MGRFLMWPRWDNDTDQQFGRYGCSGMVLGLGGTFIGMPAAFTFLAMAIYGGGTLRDWFLGSALLLFGLLGLWQLFFGGRSRPGRIYKDRKE